MIVGAGLAGAKTAEALRDEGFEGRIVLIGDEPELPYERPPLSKDYLRGESPREQARVHPEGFYAEHDIELRTSTAVTAIDTARARRHALRRRAARLRPAAARHRRPSRAGCRCRARSSTASTTSAPSPTATRSPPRSSRAPAR